MFLDCLSRMFSLFWEKFPRQRLKAPTPRLLPSSPWGPFLSSYHQVPGLNRLIPNEL